MNSFFKFTRGEWFAVVFLLLLILFSYLFYYLYQRSADNDFDISRFQQEVDEFYARQAEIEDSLLAAKEERDSRYKEHYQPQRNKKFYNRSFSRYYDSIEYKNTRPVFEKREKKQEYDILKVELNSCDTNDIKSIPQFGSKRALKMIEYRDKLGGFHSLSQITEIYILQNIEPAYLEKYFTVDRGKIRKLKINQATYQELIAHPYVDAYLSKSILNYREKNGKITSVEEFKKITHAYDALMRKLTPYLSFE